MFQLPVLGAFPEGWQAAGTGGYISGSNGELGVVSGEKGRKVFRLKSDRLIAVFNHFPMKAQKYRVRITVSGKPGSVWAFGAHYYAARHCGFYMMPRMRISGDGVWEFQLTQKYVPAPAKVMKIALQLYHGEIFIHSIELYEVEEEK